jgi:hypothetical protein
MSARYPQRQCLPGTVASAATRGIGIFPCEIDIIPENDQTILPECLRPLGKKRPINIQGFCERRAGSVLLAQVAQHSSQVVEGARARVLARLERLAARHAEDLASHVPRDGRGDVEHPTVAD